MKSLKPCSSENSTPTSSAASTASSTETMVPSSNGGARWTAFISVVISGMLFNGNIYGYASPALASFLSNITTAASAAASTFERTLPHDIQLTHEQTSWLTSIAQLGFPLGGLCSGPLMGILGMRLASLFCHLAFYVAGFGLIAFATTVEMLYAGRFLCGMYQGVCNCLIIVHTLDLCHTVQQKAICGVILAVVGNFGTLLTYIIGIFVNWRQLAAILLLFSIPYIIGLVALVPNDLPRSWSKREDKGKVFREATLESSVFLDENNDLPLKRQKLEDTYPVNEKQIVVEVVPETESCFGGRLRSKLEAVRPVFISFGVMFFYQFAGYNVITNYAASILQRSEEKLMKEDHVLSEGEASLLASIDPALLSAVFVALAGLGGVLIGVLLVHKGYNRNKILLFSASGTVVAFLMLFIYFEAGLNATNDWLWFAAFSLTLHMLIFNLGYGSLTYPAIAEILPPKIRVRGMTLIMFVGGLFGFANAKTFVDMQAFMGVGYTFLTYGSLNILGAVYLFFAMPQLS